MDESKKIEAVRHKPEKDQRSVHNAVNKASMNANFISQAVRKLEGLEFPAYKEQILNFAKSKSADDDIIALLNSLNDTILFRDKYAIKQALAQENPESKQQYQISESIRKNLAVEHVDTRQMRKDYPQTPATAMKNYICEFCGKDFQSKDQLMKHEKFEFK